MVDIHAPHAYLCAMSTTVMPDTRPPSRHASPLRSSRLVAGAALFALVVALLMLLANGRQEANILRVRETHSHVEVSAAVSSGRSLRLFSFGYPELAADLVWLNALSFFGEYFKYRHDVTWLDPYLRAITDLDPHFELVYHWAGTVIMYGGEINNESVMASSRVLEQGIERFPYSWELHFMLAINYLNELRPESPEQAAEWRRYGATMLARAGRLHGAPDWVRSSATTWMRRTSTWDQAVSAAEQQLLLSSVAADVQSGRRQLEELLSPSLAMPFLARRRLDNCLGTHPQWALQPPVLTYVLHPDPAWICPLQRIQPQPFTLTY
jgi:hypothetical protein